MIMGVSFDNIGVVKMFTFDDLDGMSRALLLKKQRETVDYWRQTYRLKAAFLAWETGTYDLVRQYKEAGGVSDLTKALDNVSIKGEITIKRLENHIKRLNEYLKDIDNRLGDGTRWYNALEIKEMFEGIEAEEHHNAN